MSNPHARAVDPFQYYEQMRAVKAYVERNLEDGEITARGAAAAAGVSRGHLAALFRRCADTTFERWLREFRIAEAKKHLATGDEPILVVLFRSGYRSLSAFECAFKKETGLTATAWRRRNAGRVSE